MTSTVPTPTATPTRTIRIGSRKSQLALVQTYWVRDELQKQFPDVTFEVTTMDTQGDKVLDVSLSKIGDKGLFTQELEDGMVQGSIDFAVHSLKDLPTRLPEGLMLGCITEREDPADALVVHEKHQDKHKIRNVKITCKPYDPQPLDFGVCLGLGLGFAPGKLKERI